MDLSIVVVNWNTRDLLRQCLTSVQGTIVDLDYEMIVVDNGSSDGSLEMIHRDFPDARIISNAENVGFARANNQAIRLSTGRHVLLLNSDAVLIGTSARRMVDLLDNRPHAAAVGGRLLNPDGSFQSSYADFPSLLSETLLLTGLSRWLLPRTFPSYPEAQSRQPRSVDWVSGAFLMVRRRALDSVGLLDEDYFMYTEEVDWCCRMWKHAWEVHYLPEARAIHWGGGTSRRVPEHKRAQLYRSKWLFMRKHRGQATAATFGLLVYLASALKLLAWRAVAMSPDPARRTIARQNVVAYRYLLASH